VIEIMRDIRGYVMILLVLLWGFSVAFAVSMPNNQAFEDGSTDRPVGRATDILQSDRCAETAVFFAPFFFHEIIYQDRLGTAIRKRRNEFAVFCSRQLSHG
jgi:hypothetical protein